MPRRAKFGLFYSHTTHILGISALEVSQGTGIPSSRIAMIYRKPACGITEEELTKMMDFLNERIRQAFMDPVLV